MSYVNQPLQKKDAMALVTGKPVYTDDLAPKDCLIIKILRSPYANAWVEEIKTDTCHEGRGNGLDPYLERCSKETFRLCRTDLSGVQSL